MMIKIILGIVIIAAVIDSGVFISDYFNKSFASDALNTQIESENQNIIQLSQKTKELNSQIAKNDTSVNGVMAVIANSNQKLPDKDISPNEVVRALLNLGQKNDVTVIPLTTQDWTRVTTQDADYGMLKMALEIVGPKENIVQTIKQIPDLYSTLVIENIVVGKPKPTTAPQLIPTPVIDQITANLTLALYAK
jgi:hypothetical protein